MATISNLYIDQGTDFSAIVSLKNQDGTPINLTGYTVASQFRKSYRSSSAVDFIATVYDATAGKVKLRLTASSTSSLTPGRFLYDVEVTSPIGEKRRALEGIIVLTPEITKS